MDPKRTLAFAFEGWVGSAESKLTHAVENMVLIGWVGVFPSGMVELPFDDTGIGREGSFDRGLGFGPATELHQR